MSIGVEPMVGLLLALVLTRVARHPRAAFVCTTVVLTALSMVPDVLADATSATKALLMLTHVVAAAIVIPAGGGRQPRWSAGLPHGVERGRLVHRPHTYDASGVPGISDYVGSLPLSPLWTP